MQDPDTKKDTLERAEIRTRDTFLSRQTAHSRPSLFQMQQPGSQGAGLHRGEKRAGKKDLVTFCLKWEHAHRPHRHPAGRQMDKKLEDGKETWNRGRERKHIHKPHKNATVKKNRERRGTNSFVLLFVFICLTKGQQIKTVKKTNRNRKGTQRKTTWDWAKLLGMGIAEILGGKKWSKMIIISTLIMKAKTVEARVIEGEEANQDAEERVYPNDRECDIDRGRHTQVRGEGDEPPMGMEQAQEATWEECHQIQMQVQVHEGSKDKKEEEIEREKELEIEAWMSVYKNSLQDAKMESQDENTDKARHAPDKNKKRKIGKERAKGARGKE